MSFSLQQQRSAYARAHPFVRNDWVPSESPFQSLHQKSYCANSAELRALVTGRVGETLCCGSESSVFVRNWADTVPLDDAVSEYSHADSALLRESRWDVAGIPYRMSGHRGRPKVERDADGFPTASQSSPKFPKFESETLGSRRLPDSIDPPGATSVCWGSAIPGIIPDWHRETRCVWAMDWWHSATGSLPECAEYHSIKL